MINIQRELKTTSKWVLIAVSMQLGTFLQAATCTSIASGNWTNAAIWSCGHVPTGGDSVIIAVDDTVTISQNHVYNGAPLQIQVYGVWYFIGGGSKITLPCGSHVEIMTGGLLLPNSNSGGHSETVRICGVTYWYYDEGPVTGYEIWPPIILPIELIAFEAEAKGEDVLLKWMTGSEIEVAAYELSVSEDIREWEQLTTVPAIGTSAGSTSYEFLDRDRGSGLWYYSLKDVGTDGSFGEPEIRSVLVRSTEQGILCMPNPVSDERLMVVLMEPSDAVQIHTIGAISRVVNEPEVLVEGDGSLILDVGTLSPGYYIAVANEKGRRIGSCSFSIMR